MTSPLVLPLISLLLPHTRFPSPFIGSCSGIISCLDTYGQNAELVAPWEVHYPFKIGAFITLRKYPRWPFYFSLFSTRVVWYFYRVQSHALEWSSRSECSWLYASRVLPPAGPIPCSRCVVTIVGPGDERVVHHGGLSANAGEPRPLRTAPRSRFPRDMVIPDP